jgi:hypothetical protein
VTRNRAPHLFATLLAFSLGCSGAATPTPRTAAGPVAAAHRDSPAPDPLGNDGWEQIRDEDGVLVWRKEIPGSPVVAFRGEGDIDAPIVVVASILMDLEHSNEWISRLVEARVLERRADGEYLTYSHLGAPFIVSDRDFVNLVDIDFAPPDRIKFNVHSVEDPKGPVTRFVRGKMLHSSFELDREAPDRTHVRCEIHADPMGDVPKWVVNHFQKGWAYTTITQLRVQADKPGIAERAPAIRELLAKHGFTM